jgi:hypothetical protein
MKRVRPTDRRGSGLLWVILVPCFSAGCVDDTEPGYKRFCKALCEEEDSCGATFTLATRRQCERDCMTDSQVLVTREEGLYLAADCVGPRVCFPDAGTAMPASTVWDKIAAVNACRAEASEGLEATSECIRYCDVILPAQQECGVSATEASCRQTACLFEATALEAATECAKVSDCDEQAACLEAALP